MHDHVNNRNIVTHKGASELNERRRGLLKWLAVGGSAFVLGKILGPGANFFGGLDLFGKTHQFKNFRVKENNDELSFFDDFGNQILVLEKDPHAGE